MGKVHLKGVPCHAERRWGCTQLTSNPNPARTTCQNCKRTAAYTDANRPHLP